jgi:hypothetical protein
LLRAPVMDARPPPSECPTSDTVSCGYAAVMACTMACAATAYLRLDPASNSTRSPSAAMSVTACRSTSDGSTVSGVK